MKRRRARRTEPLFTKKQERWHLFDKVTMILGILIAVAGINYFRITVIDVRICLVIIALTGAIVGLCASGHFYRTYNDKRIWMAYVLYTISCGFPVNYIFLALNFHFAKPELTYYEFPILEKASMSGPKNRRHERQPLVRFNYFGSEKELVFAYSQTNEVNQAKKVVISVKKGGLGFDIINSSNLM